MATYPSIGQELSSSKTILDDIATDMSDNGLLVRQRFLYNRPKNEFSVVHIVTESNKNLLLSHYYNLVDFVGSMSGTTLTVSAVSSGFLVPNTILSSTSITTSPIIVSQISGTTYGIGSYTVSDTFSFTSQSIAGDSSNRRNSFAFNWIPENTTHTVRYIAAPKITIVGNGFWNITNILREV